MGLTVIPSSVASLLMDEGGGVCTACPWPFQGPNEAGDDMVQPSLVGSQLTESFLVVVKLDNCYEKGLKGIGGRGNGGRVLER